MQTGFSIKKSGRFFIFSALIATAYSCLSPKKNFESVKTPAPPDYSNTTYWAALPDKKDSADLCIKTAGIIDCQTSAPVDVFYIHPTTYLYGNKWNADLSNKRVNKITDKHTLRNQASVFNEMCKVYAPRYRQAVLFAYKPENTASGNGPKALDLAYTDIRVAFAYYLKNYNKGRPFIIASHSQGTDHALRLLHDFFETDSTLRKQLIAAYIIGRPFSSDTVKAIAPCKDATQTGCYVTWNTVPYNVDEFYGVIFKGLVCTNPLTWSTDTTQASASLNKGSLPQNFTKLDAGLVDAKISSNGMLWIHKPMVSTKDYPTINSNRYHILDYNLFYMNIRENVKLRVNEYMRKNKP